MHKDDKTSEVSKSRRGGKRKKSRSDSHHKAADEAEHTDSEQTQDRTLDRSSPTRHGTRKVKRAQDRPQQEVKPVIQANAAVHRPGAPVPKGAVTSTTRPAVGSRPTKDAAPEESRSKTGTIVAQGGVRAAPSTPAPKQDVTVEIQHAAAAAAQQSEKGDLWTLAALFLSVTFAVVIVFFVVQSNLSIELCTTAPCDSFAKLLDASVNGSMNPCDSFGRYVCDGWRSKHSVSLRESVFRTAIEATVAAVEGVAIPDTHQNAGEQTAAFFRSCYESLVKADGGSAADEVALVRSYLAEAGVVWPWIPSRPDVLETSLFLDFELGWPAILNFKVRGSSGNSSTVILEPSAWFTRVIPLIDSRTTNDVERKGYFDALVQHYGGGGNVTYSHILDAELLMKKRLMDALALRNWATLKTNHMYPGVSAWVTALARHNVTGALRFVSTNAAFVSVFGELWEVYGDDMMHLYVSWCAVQYASIFTSRDALLATAAGGSRLASWTSSPYICLIFTYGVVGDAIFAPYSARVLKSGVRSDVAKLMFSVRKAFTVRFKDDPAFSADTTLLNEWVSIEGVFEAFDYRIKHDLHSPFLGYPDMTSSFVRNWRNVSRFGFQTEASVYVLRTIDAILNRELYTVKKNSQDFVLLPFALTSPMYDVETSVAIKYGTLGALLARASAEIALDYYGRQTATKHRLDESRECFDKDVRTMSIAPRVDVMLEAVAIEALLDAFQENSDKKHQDHEDVAGYSALETFFLSWCLMKCAAPPNERNADVDPCSAPLRHVRRFSETFRCKPETSLNPVHKCRVF
ncbi:neprilysin-1-like isoform X1 [Dermacentor albipictus]|uniref:neprilysin-1-like isoform X1 n=1 Tax=Dermacentor albipictus TaxID=60249 RepID=UPI0038FBEFA3